MADRTWPQWSEAARVERRDVAAPAGSTTELAAVTGGRWRSCVLTLRAPLAWSTAAHVLTVRAVNAPSRPAVLVTRLDRLDWRALGASIVEAVVSVHDRPCSGFVAELAPTVALEGGIAVLDVSPDPAAFGDVAERADQVTAPRAAPLLRGVLVGLDPDGNFRPLSVDASGAIETA